MAFYEILNPVLNPLLAFGPFWAITIMALVITLIVNIFYKYFTDQEEMKRLKKKMKEYQKKIKEVQKKNPQKALQIQQEAMQTNMKYMKQSFRPTLYTFLPIIIIFGWMNANLVFNPIMPGDDFTVTVEMIDGLSEQVTLSSIPELTIENPTRDAAAEITWLVSAGEPGDYKLMVNYGEKTFEKNLLVSETGYPEPTEVFQDGVVKSITINLDKVMPLGSYSIFGWKPGWLGTYIILSIIFSIVLRKAMGLA